MHVLHASILQMQRTLDQVHRLAAKNDRHLRAVLEALHRTGSLTGPGNQTQVPVAGTSHEPSANEGGNSSLLARVVSKVAAPLSLPVTRSRAPAAAAVAAPSVAPGLSTEPPSLAFLTHLTSTGSVAPLPGPGDAAFGSSVDAPRLPTGLVSAGRGLSLTSGDFPAIDTASFGVASGAGGGGASALPPPLGGSGRSLSHLLSRHTSGAGLPGGGLDVGVLFDQSFNRLATAASAVEPDKQPGETKRSRRA